VTVTHMRPRRLQPQQRREHLLDTAAAMFAEQPYDDVMIQGRGISTRRTNCLFQTIRLWWSVQYRSRSRRL
jgi:hypothetical protein